MLDTLKFAIPLTDKQHDRILSVVFESNLEQWALFSPVTGEFTFRRMLGLSEMDSESFHREIRWDLPGRYIPGDTYLIIEFSLPKFWYGHNVSLLYDPIRPLNHFKQLVEKQLRLTRLRLPPVESWLLRRADLCYAWQCPSQNVAQIILDNMKHLHYPRKQPHIYDTGILFKARTYSIKFYLKHPEFRRHDLKHLLDSGASLEWINYVEQKAEGVLRYEATLRANYLRQRKITTIHDLLKTSFNASKFELNAIDSELETVEEKLSFLKKIVAWNVESKKLIGDEDGYLHFHDGQKFDSPFGTVTCIRRTVIQELLQFFLNKFVGDKGMQLVSEVEAKLEAKFKPIKAARLLSMWLYVQRFGSQKAKEKFGDRTYYYAKADMKKADVSLVELDENVIKLSPGFFQEFKPQVPSDYVTNRYDDFRDGDNLLNLRDRKSVG